MVSLPGRDKFTRVQDLIGWGLNAPLYYRITRGSVGDPVIRILDIMSENGWDTVSIRMVKNIGGGRQFYINLDIKGVTSSSQDIIREFLSCDLMVSCGLPISDRFSGCISVLCGESFILEVIHGGPVRKLTHSIVMPDITISGHFDSYRWRYHEEYSLVEVIDMVNSTLCLVPVEKNTDEIVYEFGVFGFPVGIMRENIIFWDYEVIHGRHSFCRRF